MIKITTTQKTVIAGVLSALLLSPATQAAVSADEAAKLGNDLTPFGAEKAGNADGTIPAWTGGLSQSPAGYVAGEHYIDPFADEKPLFSITAQNVEQYRDKLADGQVAMFEKFPQTYRMDIYPSHRTHAAPDWVADNSIKNATQAELTDGGNGVEGAYGGIPFPIPQNGLEVVWNHLMRYIGSSVEANYLTLNVAKNGTITRTGGSMWQQFPYYDRNADPAAFDGNLTSLLVKYNEPARRKGEILLVTDPVNQAETPRQAWQYIPGQRRVRRAPTVAHDTPDTGAAGQITYDDSFMFNGSPERFDWKLVSKQEMYVPYNSYKLVGSLGSDVDVEQVAQPGHVNPDYQRWELHRVWVVEGTLKEGKRHIYKKRRLYVDEDSWTVLVTDRYDARDRLWRTALFSPINTYDNPATVGRGAQYYDLLSGLYVLGQFDVKPYTHIEPKKAAVFTPQGVRKMAKR